jgi:cytidyltransferase-like protein
MRKVLLVGVFDLFHFGHLQLIKRASKLGNYLIVAVQDDEYISHTKPVDALSVLYSSEERIEMIRALRTVDKVISYESVDTLVQNVDFDIFVKGPDQNHAGFVKATKWCQQNGKDVITLPRTEGISSTYLKQLLEDLGERRNK